jgi:arginine decarboxylase
MVPGQLINAETINFMRKLDVKEIHGFTAALGLKLLNASFLEEAKLEKLRAPVKERRTKEKAAA